MKKKDKNISESEEQLASDEVHNEEMDFDNCVDRIEELETQVEELNDKILRQTAEFDNYRKRTLKEKMELAKTGGEKVLTGILPIIDTFERALEVIGNTDDVEAIKEGVDLIFKNFQSFLKKNGVEEIDVINKEFDTDVSEAITKIPAPSEEMKGKVIDSTEKGYKLNDKVIRYAKVVVGE